MVQAIPFWGLIGGILLVVHHPDLGGIDHGFDFRGFDDSITDASKLVHTPPTEEFPRQLVDIKIPPVNITIPCFTVPFLGPIAKPCGNVTVDGDGVDIKTPFGTKHIPGTNVLKPYAKKLEKSFTHYTAWFVGGSAALYALVTLIVPSKRAEFIQSVKDTMAGKMQDDDPNEEAKDKDETEKDRMDPKSENFIAPGNIYRLLAVLHPGKVGYLKWSQWTFKACVCAYMQLYLPLKIIKTVLANWSFHGVKSPLWFLSEGGAFVTMFISVGSLCNLFASKCAENIRIGAEANYFILTHREPPAESFSGGGPEQGAAPEVHTGYSALIPGGLPKPPLPTLTPRTITILEFFFCGLSFFCNVSMSFLLFMAMFLKIATFTGKISGVAMVAVALYFIFDLDGKVMESDPQLKPKYRRAVIKQTAEKDYKPLWFMTLATTSRALINSLTPFGLAMIFLVAWKGDDQVIGGDPF